MNDNNTLNDNELKHLEFLQNAITRMGSNSFRIKGWAIATFAALLALFAYSGGQQVAYLLIATIPTVLFWCLDAYYLQQERKFRGIYNDVAKISPVEIRKIVLPFDMPLANYKGDKYSFWNVFWSKTMCPLYIFMAIAVIFSSIIFLFK
jgi:hypothetical protein